MNGTTIIGRQAEIRILQQALESGKAEFIALYGRRRVGKTFLIREFFKARICFELIGVHRAQLHGQLKNFSASLKKSMRLRVRPHEPVSWQDAFLQLEEFLEATYPKNPAGKQVIFFDELPWMNTPRSNFIPALEHFWNSYASLRKDLIVVVCGSAASWMIQKIVKAKGGLHNRLTRQIRLMPFTLKETEEFLVSKRIKLTRMQITELYMVMGGIPFYLDFAEPGLSAAQIIDKVCFSKDGPLREEFQKLFSSLFEESHWHNKIIELLSKKRSGISRSEILQELAAPSGGFLTSLIEELEESGFIDARIPFGKKKKKLVFKLSDEFSIFHFQWIRELGRRNPGPGYWLARLNSPRREAWSGYAFENICLKHISRIKSALGIAMVETSEGSWITRQNKETGMPGTQVDLLIDRRDATINICEIKYSESPFTINKKYAAELRLKREVFRKTTGTRKNVFLTMITTFGLNENEYSRELIQSSLTIDDLF
jgi:AAA+ ATPase superfamily predicted ATPase